MKAMGNALGAKFLLLGQVKKDDRHVRVIAHLIRVDDQTHVWATTFDRDSLDLATQSAIADEIAKAVTSRINPS
jgi:TolB-like protein